MADAASTSATESPGPVSGTVTSATASTDASSITPSDISPASSPPSTESTLSGASLATSSTTSSLVSQVSASVQSSSASQHDTLSTSVIASSTAATGLASSTATSNSPSSSPSSSSGLRTNDKVAIALVCLAVLFGAWLGGWLIPARLRRRRARKTDLAKSMVVANPRDVAPNRGPDLDQYLSVPKADGELARELRSLGYLVQQHVEDHYHVEPKFTSSGFISQPLVGLGLQGDTKGMPSPAQLANMAVNPSIRHVALQHIIMRVIFMSCTMRSESETSLLPAPVTDLLRQMPPVEEHVGNKDAFTSSLIRWRQLSVFLLNAKRSERGALQPDEVMLRAKAKELVTALNTFLEPFVPKEGRSEQETHLLDVVVECAKFGYTVFSQPAEFLWQFKAEKEVGTYVVVCPGLDKISDNYGVSCQPAVVVAPELHQI